jgi:predicted GIY-YIG superfamily endonuclease
VDPVASTLDVAEFEYAGKPIRAVTLKGDVWLVHYDVCDAIVKHPNHALFTVPPEDRVKIDRQYLAGTTLDIRGDPKAPVVLVSEFAVHDVITSGGCNRDKARAFKRWLHREMLPTVRAAHLWPLERTDLPFTRHVLPADPEVIERKRRVSEKRIARRNELRLARGRRTAVYRLRDADGELLYVGISWSVAARIAAHRTSQSWWREVATIDVEEFKNRGAALDAEARAIRTEHPRYNVQGVIEEAQGA